MNLKKGDEIPDGEVLIKYLLPSALPDDQHELHADLFRKGGDGELSTDWKRIRKNPADSFHVVKHGKRLIVEIIVCDEIRNPKNGDTVNPAWHQKILYDPVTKDEDPVNGANPAHSVIKGKGKPPILAAIARNATCYLIQDKET